MTALPVIEIEESVPTLPIGAPAPTFDGLLGTDGSRHGLAEFAAKDIVVLIFSSNRCPTVKAYGDRLVALQAEYGDRGVQLMLINSNSPYLYPDERVTKMVERATEDGYVFPYLADEGQVVARAYGPTCTFHVFVLDPTRALRYQGRFDDSRLADRVTSHDLRDALDDLLAGRDVRRPITRPFGCSLDYV